MELIVMSAAHYFAGEAALINQLFAAGLTRFHLRKPAADEEQFRRLLAEIDPLYYPCLAIHQHHELAEEFSIRRLHYSEAEREKMQTATLDELRGQGFYLSSSVHRLEELIRLQGFDYVFFGPVYDSISKKGYQTVLGADFLLPQSSSLVIAIGGIRADKLGGIQTMGFGGAALLGAIWHSSGFPLVEFEKTITAFKKLHYGNQ